MDGGNLYSCVWCDVDCWCKWILVCRRVGGVLLAIGGFRCCDVWIIVFCVGWCGVGEFYLFVVDLCWWKLLYL